jgi:hypothetical protein
MQHPNMLQSTTDPMLMSRHLQVNVHIHVDIAGLGATCFAQSMRFA